MAPRKPLSKKKTVPKGKRSPKVGPKVVGSNQPMLQNMLNRALTPKLTGDGLAFLKCATSSPDFSVDPGKGIPDKYSGRVINVKDCSTTSISFTPNTDTYIVVAPVPGIAYFKSEVAIGTQPNAFVAVPYSTYTSNFGSVNQGTAGDDIAVRPSLINYNKFRYASLASGIYPTSNMMQYGGSISVWKADISLGESTTSAVTNVATIPPNSFANDITAHHLIGCGSINPLVPRDNYTESFIKGSFTSSFDNSGDFEWSYFLYDPTYTAMETTVLASGIQNAIMQFNGPTIGTSQQMLTGWGNCETIVHKITTGTGAVNTANLKVWNCIEMQVNTNSNIYQYSHTSPHYDEAALQIYAKIRNELPVAVPCAMNANFWQRVLALIRGVVKGASYVPGPVGLIGQGLSALI